MENSSQYQSNQPYHYESVDDVRTCVVPQPDSVRTERGMLLKLPNTPDHVRYPHSRYGNPSFLEAVARGHELSTAYQITKWHYNNRRTAQFILPFMLLGPISFARDINEIRNAGITMMVAVRSKRVAQTRPSVMDPAKFPSAQGIQTATFDVDTPYDVSHGRETILKQINDHLEGTYNFDPNTREHTLTGRILVFCETGNERSPVLPALYLMTVWGMEPFNAVQIIQARRFGIALPPDIVAMLQDVYAILTAERQVALTVPNGTEQTLSNRKRSIAEPDESDDHPVRDRKDKSVGRQGTAPFSDVHL